MSNLPNGWIEIQLFEVGKIITGKTPSKNNPEDWGNKYDFITPTDIKDDSKFIDKTSRFISEKGKNRFQNMMIDKYSIIVTCIGSDMGKVVINKNIALTNQQINSIIIYASFDKDFIYYKLKSEYKLLKRLAGSGSTMPLLNKSDFSNIKITVPKSLSEQKDIANILSSFDKKIELLKEQNQTLETMAQTIFKEWFIDFNYPNATGEMIDSEMGEIPKGWRVGIFDEIIEFINGYAFKSDELEKVEDIDSYAIFKMGHIKKGGGFNPTKTKDYISKNQCTKLEKYILKSGDILMCMTDMKDSTSLLGHTALMFEDEKYIVNQRVGLIRPNNNVDINYPWLYILTNSHGFISDLRNRANSGVQINLSTSEIKNTKIIIPDKETNKLFNLLTLPIFEKMKNIYFQIQTLEETRDSLLPKLMSGKTRIQGFKVD
ncbi:MAG: restriction endonuclease subunit S [Arcobacter sp.]|uniref:restriction endonuclease subunit S n=1 Tax=Arcobacter sp. TaxID=1872629 RepID=UPI003D092EE6